MILTPRKLFASRALLALGVLWVCAPLSNLSAQSAEKSKAEQTAAEQKDPAQDQQEQSAEEGIGPDLAELSAGYKAGRISADDLAGAIVSWTKRYQDADLPAGVLSLKDQTELRQSLARELAEQSVRILRDEDSTSVIGIGQVYRTFFSRADESFRRFEALLQLCESAEHFESVGDVESLLGLYREKQDPDQRSVLEPRIARSVRKAMQEALAQGDPITALNVVSHVPAPLLEHYFAEEISSAIVQLQRLISQDAAARDVAKLLVSQRPFRAFLAESVAKDSGLAVTLASIYERLIELAVREERLSEARDFFEELVRVRRDPSPENNKLRQRIVLESHSEAMRSFAAGRVEELRIFGDFPLPLRMKLLFNGFYGKAFPILLICSVLLFLMAAIALLVAPRLRGIRIVLPHFKLPTFGAPKRSGPGYLAPTQGDDEYSSLLALFGLDDSADSEAIKHAYRSATKALHPDRLDQSAPDYEEQIETFRQMQRAYDRIVEIRASWFGGRQ